MQRLTTFTQGRYAEVMRDARDIVVERCGEPAGFPILPRMDGPRVVRMGQSRARQYWARYWIQLYLQIVGWLEPDQRTLAQARLEKLEPMEVVENYTRSYFEDMDALRVSRR